MDSDWALCRGVFEAVRAICKSKESPTIVEFGSGEGTEILADIGKVYSIEHDENWILNYGGVEYIHSPLSDIEPIPGFGHKQWYNHNVIFNNLPSSYEVLIVDGPPGSVGRSGILNHLSEIPDNVVWIIDDTLRREESDLSDTIAISNSMIQYRFWNFSILTNVPIDFDTLENIRATSFAVMSERPEEKIRLFFPAYRRVEELT